jgi:hypothetical protein
VKLIGFLLELIGREAVQVEISPCCGIFDYSSSWLLLVASLRSSRAEGLMLDSCTQQEKNGWCKPLVAYESSVTSRFLEFINVNSHPIDATREAPKLYSIQNRILQSTIQSTLKRKAFDMNGQ